MIAENAMLNARATARVARTIHIACFTRRRVLGDPRGRPGCLYGTSRTLETAESNACILKGFSTSRACGAS